MKVLVFGASGYIGKHVTRRLVADGLEVTGVIRNADKGTALKAGGAAVLVASVSDMATLGPAIDAHDAVIWIAQVMLEEEDRTMRAFIDRLAGTGKALIFTSGTSLLSEPTQGDWSENSFAEDEPFIPRRQVAERLQIENLVRAAQGAGVRAIVIRPPLIWGHGGSRIISDLYHSAKVTGSVCYVGRGLNCYTNVHVDDLADLYARALQQGVGGALYHATAGEASYRAMAEAVAGAIGTTTRSVTVEEAIEIWDRFMGKVVFPSCSRTRSPRSRRELNWRPDPDRCDILDDCRDTAYAAQGERALPSWVRPS